mgnify:CR=1 FL=1
MNLPETKPRVVIISSYANRRAKTSIGGDYVIYLEEGKWFMTNANSLYPSREMSFLELWRWLKAESEYNLTRHGTAARLSFLAHRHPRCPRVAGRLTLR